jgi:hypothetical protein
MIRSLIFIAALLVPTSRAAQAPPPRAGQGPRITDVLFEDYNGALYSRWQMKPGEDVALSFRVENFGRQEQLDKEGLREDRVELHYQIELRDPEGVPVAPEQSGDVNTTLRPQDGSWRPKIDWTAKLPPTAPGGEYAIGIRLSDRIAQKDVERNVLFRVVGPRLAARDSLEVRQLEYSISERGPWSRERYFAPSETIWVRYQVAGYGLSPEKQVSVEEDWTVLDAGGKIIATKPVAMVEDQQSFYPPRFLTAEFSLTLQTPKPGKYTLRIVVRDKIRGQSIEFDSDFFLRR